MIKRILGQISLSLLLFSCAESPMDFQEGNAADDFGGAFADDKMTVLKERNPEYPWEPVVYKSHRDTATSRSVQQLTHPDYLGYSYRNEFYPIEDTKNLGYKVIDTERLSKDFPSYFQSWKSPSAQANAFSYSSFEDYLSKSTTTKKVSSGFSLNLKVFSIGNKNNYTDVFTKEVTTNDKFVFGELNVTITDSCHRMQYSSNIKDKIIKNYVDPVFFEEYHYLHPYELFKNYGGFVARDFITGGKATALYLGLYKKESTSETKTRDMDTEITSTFSLDTSADKSKTNLSLGRGKNSTVSTTKQFSSVQMSVKTLGGSPLFNGFTIPTEVGNTQLDLSSWMASLENKSTTSIIEFNNEGLVPITDFILEENVKKTIHKYIENSATILDTIVEPKIIYQVDFLDYHAIIFIHLLENRHGICTPLDYTVLPYTMHTDTINNELIKINAKYADLFGVKAENNWYDRRPYLRIGKDTLYRNIGQHKYSKFIHNGILFFIDEIDKVGFSIPNDSRYLNQYGIRDAINRMEQSSVNYQDLIEEDYAITAL